MKEKVKVRTDYQEEDLFGDASEEKGSAFLTVTARLMCGGLKGYCKKKMSRTLKNHALPKRISWKCDKCGEVNTVKIRSMVIKGNDV